MTTTYGPGVHGTGGISTPDQLPPSSPGYNPNPTVAPDPSTLTFPSGLTIAEAEAQQNLPPSSLPSLADPSLIIAPEQSIAGIQSVFGTDWQPAPAFADLQSQGIFGAVRVGDSPNVFVLGPGGSTTEPISAQGFFDMFGTSEQGGIVGNITQQQANQLGIGPGAVATPVGPGISGQTLASGDSIDLTGADVDTTKYDSDIAIAGYKEYLELQKALTTQAEKDAIAEAESLQNEIKDLLGEDAVSPEELQLQEEKKRNIEEQQQAVDDANAELQIKIAEIDALTASFNLENQIVEGKPITLSSIRGQQAQNYKMYLAQKNLLTSEAGLLQARALGLQGKLDSAQRAADRAVDLKWNAYERELNNRIQLYNIVKGQLNDLQQERGDALNKLWNLQLSAAADAKAAEKNINAAKLSLITKYKVGSLDNTLEELTALVQGTATYRKETRIAPTGGGLTPEQKDWYAAGGLEGTGKTQQEFVKDALGLGGPTQTFDQYLEEQQNLAGQTFAPEKRAELRQEFEAGQPLTYTEDEQKTVDAFRKKAATYIGDDKEDVFSKLNAEFGHQIEEIDIRKFVDDNF